MVNLPTGDSNKTTADVVRLLTSSYPKQSINVLAFKAGFTPMCCNNLYMLTCITLVHSNLLMNEWNPNAHLQ